MAIGLGAAAFTHELVVVLVVVSFVAMVMLHEFGHFVVAKLSGMKVTEYFVGFGPVLWSVRRKDTTYGVKAIPAGGYVKIAGMTNLEVVDPKDEPRTYRQASFPRRLAVGLAGSMVHFFLAFVLLWSILVFAGTEKVASGMEVVGFAPLAGVKDPAREAGVRLGDVIVSVDGHPVGNGSVLDQVIGTHAGRPVRLEVERRGRKFTLVVIPVNRRLHAEQGAPALAPKGPPVGAIGVVVQSPLVILHYNPIEGVAKAGFAFGSLVSEMAGALGSFFSLHGLAAYVEQVVGKHVSSARAASRPLSVVGAGELAVDAARAGARYFLLVLAEVNLFVGIFNLVPLLPLDGGHVAIAIYERIRSRRGRRYHADVAKLMPATYVVVLLVLLLGITAAYLDVTHPLPNPFQ